MKVGQSVDGGLFLQLFASQSQTRAAQNTQQTHWNMRSCIECSLNPHETKLVYFTVSTQKTQLY